MSLLRDIREQGPAVLRARWYLRTADRVGRRVRVWGRPRIGNSGRMTIGNRARFSCRDIKLELFTDVGGVLEIGDSVFINYGTSISASQLVRIGEQSHIGTYCILIDNAFHHVEPELRLQRPESKPIILGRNVWLGARVIVLPGVTIGDDSVVAAGSVVSRDVPARTLVGGVPARFMREI